MAHIYKGADCAEGLIKEFNIQKFPSLMLKTTLGEDKPKIIEFKNKHKIEDMTTFVNSYALKPENSKEERVVSSNKNKEINERKEDSGFYFIENIYSLENEVLNNHKAAIVLYIENS